MEAHPPNVVHLEQIADYRFEVDFGMEGVEPLLVDEPAPLGEGAGPNPSRLLAAALANCLCASLLFCMRKSRLGLGRMKATVTTETKRNERGRLRIGAMSVVIDLEEVDDPSDRLSRCLAIFEDFCVVTATVREGVRISVTVRKNGLVVHTS